MIMLSDVMANENIAIMIEQANACMEAMGYTDHGPRHVGYVSRITRQILKELDFDDRTVELGAIAGWVHDVGNAFNRDTHAQIGATVLMPLLREMGMPFCEVMRICTAVGNHDEQSGCPVSEISAALIIADKIDAHRARVRRNKYDFEDIHDRVNYSIRNTQVTIDAKNKIIRFACTMDDSSSVKEFLNIYMSRMTLSEAASKFLGCSFEFVVNGMLINNTPIRPKTRPLPPQTHEQEPLV
ncbi:MAG: HD domain-containing protein [Christensenellales bacterium]|jgi:metal-dependent HD superfamily phosphatase/phosphodiesterase